MSEIINGRLGFYGTEHSKSNHMMALGFKGLTSHSTHVRSFRGQSALLIAWLVQKPGHRNQLSSLILANQI